MLTHGPIQSALRHEGGLTRRLFLAQAAAIAALPAFAAARPGPVGRPAFDTDPFRLGVASGDPSEDGMVLWTRLCPRPLEPDHGMPQEAVAVRWEIAENESMSRGVRRGTTLATPQLAHSVHVEVTGLRPGRTYWYRFHAGGATSPVGRTRTLPPRESLPAKLRFAFASCQHLEHGHFTAYRHMAAQDPDFVVHLGDYIYEGPGKEGQVRRHTGPEKGRLQTLRDYRIRHSQYRSDPDLQAMHARCPWWVTWDDHEFDNNYANTVPDNKETDPATFLIRRAAAYQAYYEAMPLRSSCIPAGPDLRLYRGMAFGRLAEFQILDTRQYRTDQPNGDGPKPLNAAALDPANSLLGREQRNWLDSRLIASQGRWNVIAQQVMMGMVARVPKADGAERTYSMDQWPGAAHERMALARFWQDRRVPNPVVLTGDIHSNWVNDLRVDDRIGDSPVVATEFVGTSISSGGKGGLAEAELGKLQAENPCVRFFSRERGYVLCTVTPEQWRSDYLAAEDVTQPNGPVVLRRSFVVESGKAGAIKA